MNRYGCFQIRTSCGSCGQPVPVNGPFRELTCGSCFEKVSIPADIYAGFMNDFEEEYEGYAEGEGSGGTLMSGSGTYKYGVWRLTPRCSSCKRQLVIPDPPGMIRCECGTVYHLCSGPDWLTSEVPSLLWYISREAPPGSEMPQSGSALAGADSQKPIVMNCPQCSGALSISAGNERIMTCSYCDSEVYIPDAIWKRLHPVKKVQEWFACFQGKTEKQLLAERRVRDKEEEKEELAGWKARALPEKVRNGFRPYVFLAFTMVLLYLTGAVIESYSGKGNFLDALRSLAPFGFALLAVGIPVFMVFRILFSGRTGHGKACRNAMEALALSNDWEHRVYGNGPGEIRETVRGREIEIHPGEEYAVEVDINESVFYLKTEPPGYPPEGMHRFTTGDSEFDSLFPFRYAEPEIAARLENGEMEALKPVKDFLDRWAPRLGRLQIDWSSVSVHITPGCNDPMDSGSRYLLPEDFEPLLNHTMKLAEELDGLAE